MNLKLNEVPWSIRGSYMAFSNMEKNFRQSGIPEGLYLKNIRNDRISAQGIALPVARIVPLLDKRPAVYELRADAGLLELKMNSQVVRICFADPKTILFEGDRTQTGLLLAQLGDIYSANYVNELSDANGKYYLLNLYKNRSKYILRCLKGTIRVNQNWQVDNSPCCEVNIYSDDQGFLTVLEEIPAEWTNRGRSFDFARVGEENRRAFLEFYNRMPRVPEKLENTAKLAAYVDWVSLVEPDGFIKRETMYMSKNWMTAVWSWDHCFNAIALAKGHPALAWDQFMALFDDQDSTGLIPDMMSSDCVNFNWCKPPIHGWTLKKLMERMDLSRHQLLEAYKKIGLWTQWWLTYRDDPDGLPMYYHGNDSGWDNSTAFKSLPPVETPDLAAFLIEQTEVLSHVAQLLKKPEESRRWAGLSEKLLKRLLNHGFHGTQPVARDASRHTVIQTQSLILYMPLILGTRLLQDIRDSMVETLWSEVYHTKYGFATEALDSPEYEADGYWRGPIWAPVTVLLADGLKACGESGKAKQIAEEFCSLVEKNGCAENFDAKTGDGLRDRAYTWTASAFFILANEYLLDKSY